MIRNYQIIEKIGKGTFGIVYKVRKYNDPLIYVIKQISLSGLTDYQINQVYAEAKILSLIKSKYVVRYYESFLEDDNLNIVMEYCDNGDLCNYLNEQKKKSMPLKEDLIWKIFIKITLGLATIHKMKILHRDLKTLNIFLKKDMEIKIGDLGVAKELNQASFANTIIGTPYYLSPEMCEDKPYNQKSDVWALGVILYELCTFRHPFNAGNHAALILKIMTANPEPILACYSNNLQKIVNCILEKKIEKRPNCWDLLNMPIISEKAKMIGLYNEIMNICFDEYYYNENNKNINTNNQIGNYIHMDSGDILLQSNLIPLDKKNTKIHVKKINNEIKRISNKNLNINNNYVFGDKINEGEFQNNYINNRNINVNVYKIGNQKNTIQNNYINNFNNINQIPYNYNNHQNNINNANYNNYDFTKGNYIMFNNNYNNLYNNNLNQNNNIIYNNILINNNTINTNDPSLINNINKSPNYVKVTRVYKQPKIERKDEYIFEDKNINDINDSLNISIQVSPVDMDRDRLSDKIQSSINDFSNQKDLENNNYNYHPNADVQIENFYDYGEDYPKDNTRNQNNKTHFVNNNDESEQINSERMISNNIGNKKNEKEEERENNGIQQNISIKRSNSLIEKDISPIKLITNTQESINIMENIKNLNLDEGYNSNSKSKNGIEYKKKKLNVPNMSNKKKVKIKNDKFDDIEDINNKKFNKTIDNLSSSDVFNMNIEHQDTIPLKNYLTSNNLKYNSRDSLDSDSDYNILKNSENDINNSDNKKIIEQKIQAIDIEEKDNNYNYSIDEEEDINSLEAKVKNIKKEIYILIGENNYSYLNNLYSEINNKENLFKEIEQFIESHNFTKIKKEKLLDLFLTLITTEAKIRDKRDKI